MACYQHKFSLGSGTASGRSSRPRKSPSAKDSLTQPWTPNPKRPNFDKTNFCCDVSSFVYEDNIVRAVSCWSSISVFVTRLLFRQRFDQCQSITRKLSVANLLRWECLVDFRCYVFIVYSVWSTSLFVTRLMFKSAELRTKNLLQQIQINLLLRGFFCYFFSMFKCPVSPRAASIQKASFNR